MLKYILKRIVTMIPMLIGISLLSFIISINAPADPIEKLAKASESEGSAQESSVASKKIKQQLRKELGLDLPIFYFSISDLSSSDTLHKVQDRDHQSNLNKLTHESGNWKAVSSYYNSLLTLQRKYEKINVKDITKKDTTLDEQNITEAYNQFGIEIANSLSKSDKEYLDISFKKMFQLS